MGDLLEASQRCRLHTTTTKGRVGVGVGVGLELFSFGGTGRNVEGGFVRAAEDSGSHTLTLSYLNFVNP